MKEKRERKRERQRELYKYEKCIHINIYQKEIKKERKKYPRYSYLLTVPHIVLSTALVSSVIERD